MTQKHTAYIAEPFYSGIAADPNGFSIAALPAGRAGPPAHITLLRNLTTRHGLPDRLEIHANAAEACVHALASFGTPRLVAVLAYPRRCGSTIVRAAEFGVLLRLYLLAAGHRVIEVPLGALYEFAVPGAVPVAGTHAAPASRPLALRDAALPQAVLLATAACALDRPDPAGRSRPCQDALAPANHAVGHRA